MPTDILGGNLENRKFIKCSSEGHGYDRSTGDCDETVERAIPLTLKLKRCNFATLTCSDPIYTHAETYLVKDIAGREEEIKKSWEDFCDDPVGDESLFSFYSGNNDSEITLGCRMVTG